MLGTSGGTVEMLRYAKSIGVYTIVTDYLEPAQSRGKQIADEYWMISTADVDLLEQKCLKENITAVFAGVSEFNLDRAFELCERLGLPFYCSREAWNCSRSKIRFKKACRQYGVPVAEDYILSESPSGEALSGIRYPVVVKPDDLSASLGMSYCHNREELIRGYQTARSMSEDPHILIEHMMQGREWGIYYVLAKGNIRPICVDEELFVPEHLSNLCIFDTTVTDCVEDILAEVNPYMEDLLEGIGASEGVAWVELMQDTDRHFYVLEMGYRMSGDLIEKTFPYVMNFDPYQWMINLALGGTSSPDDLPAPLEHMPEKCGSTYWIRASREGTIVEIQGLDDLNAHPDIDVSLYLQPGQQVSYRQVMGIISIRSNDCDKLCEVLLMINATLHILNERNDDIFIRYTDYGNLKQTYENGMKRRY